jgi:hypothetical protein
LGWENPDEDAVCIEWGREVFRALEPFSSDREYFNFPGLYEDGDQSVRDTFGANLGRLQSVKRKYDPDNLFRLNHNIRRLTLEDLTAAGDMESQSLLQMTRSTALQVDAFN